MVVSYSAETEVVMVATFCCINENFVCKTVNVEGMKKIAKSF